MARTMTTYHTHSVGSHGPRTARLLTSAYGTAAAAVADLVKLNSEGVRFTVSPCMVAGCLPCRPVREMAAERRAFRRRMAAYRTRRAA